MVKKWCERVASLTRSVTIILQRLAGPEPRPIAGRVKVMEKKQAEASRSAALLEVWAQARALGEDEASAAVRGVLAAMGVEA